VAAAIAVICLLPTAVAAWPEPTVRVEPARLRELILASKDRPYQGYADTRGEVGLPDLPVLGDVGDLFSGTTRIRAWHATPLAWRVAVVTATGETDIYRTQDGTYVWDFERNQLTGTLGEPPVRLPRASDLLPPELARRLLSDQAVTLAAIASQRVAGIVAAGVRLKPTDPDTTVGSVDVWADPNTGLPLRVEVAGRDGAPLFTSRFLELTQRAPDAALLKPTWPKDAGFTGTTAQDIAAAINGVAPAALPASLGGRPRQTGNTGVTQVTGLGVYGTGLATFAVVALPGRTGTQALQRIKEGGGVPAVIGNAEAYEVHSTLLNAVIVRGRRRVFVLGGPVSADLLMRAAAELVGVRL
jgi:hypothetical protein